MSHSSLDEQYKLLLDANTDVLDFFQNVSSDLISIAHGSEPMVTNVNLKNIWAASELDNRINRLQESIRILKKFNRFVSLVQSRSSFYTTLQVTTSELNEIHRLIDQCVIDFYAAHNELMFMKETLKTREQTIGKYINQLGDQVETEVTINGTSIGDFNTRHSWYVSADAGIGLAPKIDEVFPYFGVNIYFRPVNKEAPLNMSGFQFSRRFSLMLGVTIKDIKKEGERENLFGNTMMVVGAGIRLLDSIRLNGGMLIFKEPDPDPSSDDLVLASSPFFSLSFDWNIASTLGVLGSAFGITK
jgi:hypothetical protein